MLSFQPSACCSVEGALSGNTTSASASVTTPGECFPPGTSMALRPTCGKHGHLVIWLLREQHPPAPRSPFRNAGSRKPRAEPSSKNYCKTVSPLSQGHPPAPFCEGGSQWAAAGPCPPTLGQSCSSGLGPHWSAHCDQEALPTTQAHTFLHRICLAGTQLSPINTWPGPALRPQRVFTLRDRAPTCVEAKTRSYLGEYEIPLDPGEFGMSAQTCGAAQKGF